MAAGEAASRANFGERPGGLRVSRIAPGRRRASRPREDRRPPMYVARFSYELLPINRQRGIEFIQREIEAARKNKLNARRFDLALDEFDATLAVDWQQLI